MQLKPGESLILPEELRENLSKPVGKIYNDENIYKILKDKEVIAVGDETTLTMIKLKIKTKLSIFDLKTKRMQISDDLLNNFPHRIIVSNDQGKITYYLINAIKISLEKNIPAIQVIGEEDLASLVCITMVPNGVIIIYGIPNMGITVIEVNDDIKKITNDIISKMVIENGA